MTRRWIVDGMNAIGTRPDGWWNDPDRAMRRFTAALDRFAAATGDEVTVVFDKKPRKDPPAGRSVAVRFARWKGRNAADHEIEMMVQNDDDPSTLLVVTSDKRLVEKVRALGAVPVGSGGFRDQMDGASSE